jgi:hypothetical protein
MDNPQLMTVMAFSYCNTEIVIVARQELVGRWETSLTIEMRHLSHVVGQ